jgi:hypothetical protein
MRGAFTTDELWDFRSARPIVLFLKAQGMNGRARFYPGQRSLQSAVAEAGDVMVRVVFHAGIGQNRQRGQGMPA